MSEQSQSDESWMREELDTLLTDFPIEDDCDSVARQLSRDIFYGSTSHSLDTEGVETMLLHLYGGYDVTQEGSAAYMHDRDELQLRPLGKTALGILCEMVGDRNQFDEPEHLLLSGSFFCTSQEIQPGGHYGYIADENWPVKREQAVTEITYNREPMLLLPGEIATGGRLAYKQIFTVQEMEYLHYNDTDFDKKDFVRVEGLAKGERRMLFAPKYVFLSPQVVVGVEARDNTKLIFDAQLEFNEKVLYTERLE